MAWSGSVASVCCGPSGLARRDPWAASREGARAGISAGLDFQNDRGLLCRTDRGGSSVPSPPGLAITPAGRLSIVSVAPVISCWICERLRPRAWSFLIATS